jgi:hypothetical protein
MYKYAYYKKMSLKERLVYGADSHFYQYVSHILEVSYIDGGNRSIRRKY